MELSAKTSYTEDLVNEAAFLYWKKTFANTFIISILGVMLALALIFYFDSKDWILGSFLAISLISSTLFFWSFFIFRNRSMAIFKEMGNPTVSWKFTNEGISAESDAGKTEIKWNMLKGIVKSNNVWLFVYKNNAYSTFPLANVSSETLEFLTKKIN